MNVCKFCNTPCNDEECADCWEVRHRFGEFIETPKNKEWAAQQLEIRSKTIVDYEVARTDTALNLNRLIKSKLPDGWQPFGSIQAIPNHDDIAFYVQAMVKYA